MFLRVVLSLLAIVAVGILLLIAGDSAAVSTSLAAEPTPTPVVASAMGNSQIWSALVIASNSADPKPAPAELQTLAPRMKRVFGYNQFELIGSTKQEIDEQSESWLVPSKSFWMGVKARRALSKEAQGGFLLSLQLYQDKRPLVDTEAKLAPGSPLLIRGPQYGKGQVIIILQVQK